ncbi:hypothetical protein B0H14DRAFT_2315917, partial [Mycena olivaceomarginata]
VVQERLDSIKYPLLTLPNEVTIDIFTHFPPVYPLCPPLVGNLSPTTLTHVCRKWREIALAIPILWRALGFSSNSDRSQQCRIRDIWLSRSGSQPLSLSIDDCPAKTGSSFLPDLLSHRSHQARWEHLELVSHQRLLPHIEGELPLLRHLHLDSIRPIVCTVHPHDAPLLRTVVIACRFTTKIALPWRQLTSLTLRYDQSSRYAEILRQASNLVHCELFIQFRSTPNGPVITLPHLESLILVQEEYASGLPELLSIFIVPALRSLEV